MITTDVDAVEYCDVCDSVFLVGHDVVNFVFVSGILSKVNVLCDFIINGQSCEYYIYVQKSNIR